MANIEELIEKRDLCESPDNEYVITLRVKGYWHSFPEGAVAHFAKYWLKKSALDHDDLEVTCGLEGSNSFPVFTAEQVRDFVEADLA